MELDSLHVKRLSFLSVLPTLLNSSLESRHVITVALQHVKSEINADAATVFVRVGSSRELVFWALKGEQAKQLEGKKISLDVGIVGWVCSNAKAVLSNSVKDDPRFFAAVDRETSYETKSMICVPLVIRGNHVIGAIQVLNSVAEHGFEDEDLVFLEHFAHQVALALENARLFEELKMRAHQLAVLDRRKQDMMTVLTHELRTPVNVIQSAAEMLAEARVGAEDRETLLKTLKNGISRLLGVVSRLGQASNVTAAQLKLSPAAVAIAPLFEELRGVFAEPLEQRKLRLLIECPADTSAVHADPTLLRVVLNNLLSNAIRFTADGGELRLGAKGQAGLVELYVSDTGIGIAPEHKALIFEKFFEVTEALSHTSGTFAFRSCGLGLGLAAAKAIAESHGASIDVKSELGKGSTFSFCLKPA